MYHQQSVVYTEYVTKAATTITLSATSSETATATVTLAAPTFTQVFGPRTGCMDVAANFKAEQLPNNVKGEGEAAQKCKDMCTQRGNCEHVYVQHMMADYGSTLPYFECFFNDHCLSEETDLECGQRPGTYGRAIGWDAIGRGQ
ncbi:hypothetical protein MBLNU230_g4755t1 [Neophaeotheca triangularis]